MEKAIDICILLGLFYFTFNSLARAFTCFSNVKAGLSYFEAGCCFLVLSMFCASFFPMRQHMSNSTATHSAKEEAREEGKINVENMWIEKEPKLIDSIATVIVMTVIAWGIRFGEMFIKTAIPVYYSIIVIPATPYFLYHFLSWGFR